MTPEEIYEKVVDIPHEEGSNIIGHLLIELLSKCSSVNFIRNGYLTKILFKINGDDITYETEEYLWITDVLCDAHSQITEKKTKYCNHELIEEKSKKTIADNGVRGIQYTRKCKHCNYKEVINGG